MREEEKMSESSENKAIDSKEEQMANERRIDELLNISNRYVNRETNSILIYPILKILKTARVHDERIEQMTI